MFDEISSFIERIPPLTRYICLSTFFLSLSAQFGLVNPMQLILDMKQIVNFQVFQAQLKIVLEAFYMYVPQLWLWSFNAFVLCALLAFVFGIPNVSWKKRVIGRFAKLTSDCFMMLVFIMLSISVIGMAVKLAVLTNSFSMAIVYIWSSLNPEEIVQFMFGLRFKV